MTAHIAGQLIAVRSDWDIQGYLWFLPCLFLSCVMLYAIWRYTYKSRYIVTVVLAVIGVIYNHFIGISLPFSLDMSLIAIIFVAFGIMIFKHVDRITWPICGACFILTVIISLINGKTDMWSSDLGNSYLLFFTGGIAGSVMMIKISRAVKKHVFLSACGKNSLVIYIFHFIFLWVANFAYGKLPVQNELINNIWCVIMALAIAWALMPVCSFITKRLQWTIGLPFNGKR